MIQKFEDFINEELKGTSPIVRAINSWLAICDRIIKEKGVSRKELEGMCGYVVCTAYKEYSFQNYKPYQCEINGEHHIFLLKADDWDKPIIDPTIQQFGYPKDYFVGNLNKYPYKVKNLEALSNQEIEFFSKL